MTRRHWTKEGVSAQLEGVQEASPKWTPLDWVLTGEQEFQDRVQLPSPTCVASRWWRKLGEHSKHREWQMHRDGGGSSSDLLWRH